MADTTGTDGPRPTKWRPVLAILFSVVAYSVGPALALDNLTGNKLYEMCLDPSQQGACDGYILGVADGATMIVPKAYCMSDGVDVEQMRDIVVAFLKKDAAQRDSPAAYLVFWGLADVFACKAK